MVTTATKNRTWIWYLALVALLTTASISTLVVFNVRQQLTAEKLDQAEARWQEKKPASYNMTFTKHIDNHSEKFTVQVRQGTVVVVELDGRPLEERQNIYYSMEALFDYVRRFLEIDAEPGKRRPYVIASFDPADGHLVRYIRSDGVQRVELHVQELKPVE
ncbi:MAG: DUF6174 domain-containing protein [Gemmataceae bacterium]